MFDRAAASGCCAQPPTRPPSRPSAGRRLRTPWARAPSARLHRRLPEHRRRRHPRPKTPGFHRHRPGRHRRRPASRRAAAEPSPACPRSSQAQTGSTCRRGASMGCSSPRAGAPHEPHSGSSSTPQHACCKWRSGRESYDPAPDGVTLFPKILSAPLDSNCWDRIRSNTVHVPTLISVLWSSGIWVVCVCVYRRG